MRDNENMKRFDLYPEIKGDSDLFGFLGSMNPKNEFGEMGLEKDREGEREIEVGENEESDEREREKLRRKVRGKELMRNSGENGSAQATMPKAGWKTFYAASIFFEILYQFDPAADIRKAIEGGRKPVPCLPRGGRDTEDPIDTPMLVRNQARVNHPPDTPQNQARVNHPPDTPQNQARVKPPTRHTPESRPSFQSYDRSHPQWFTDSLPSPSRDAPLPPSSNMPPPHQITNLTLDSCREKELETHTISAWKEAKLYMLKQSTEHGKLFSKRLAGPHENLKDFTLKILQNRVATLSITHSTSDDGLYAQLLYLALLSEAFCKFIADIANCQFVSFRLVHGFQKSENRIDNY
ncbi:hypothetical protein Tco_0508275 [Tanacetum coccineum]